MQISFDGPLENIGHVYNIINRNIVNSLKRNHIVLENQHGNLSEIFIQHRYPPKNPNIKHQFNICLTAWEFEGEKSFPKIKIDEINQFDLLLTPTNWMKNILQPQLDIPVDSIYWGLDDSFYRQNKYQPFKHPKLKDKKVILWIGGTDPRHGFDIALEVINQLSNDYILLAKQNKYYPLHNSLNDKVLIVHDDLNSLIPLYRCADLFLHTARGVGFSLPILEANACKLPIVSTNLPPLHEFKYFNIQFSEKGTLERMYHHLYSDCVCYWYKPVVESLVDQIKNIEPFSELEYPEFMEYYKWENAVNNIMEKIIVYS